MVPSHAVHDGIGATGAGRPADPAVSSTGTCRPSERPVASYLCSPSGIAGHVEAGVAYGLGKPCYALGAVEKTETLYCVFERIFPDLAALDR